MSIVPMQHTLIEMDFVLFYRLAIEDVQFFGMTGLKLTDASIRIITET